MSTNNGQKTCTIAGKEKLITIPRSFASLRDVVAASTENMNRAMYAALGLCVTFRPPLPFPYKGDPLGYGGDVMDELHTRGASMADIDAAALECWKACLDAYLPDDEIETRADFTEAREETGT